ncbi:hypothetical protein ES708_31785 [subsurface metagenome]
MDAITTEWPEINIGERRVRYKGRIATLTTARKQHRCEVCPEPIKPKENYFSIVMAGSGLGGIKFPDRCHVDCLPNFFKKVKTAKDF